MGIDVRQVDDGAIMPKPYNDTLCLNCPITSGCDEGHLQCFYKIWIQETGKDRKDYYRKYYQANRAKKISAASERNRNNPEYRQYQIEYKLRRKSANEIRTNQ